MAEIIPISKGTGYGVSTPNTPEPLHGGGEPPDNGPMDARVAELEDFALDTRERLARIETKLDTFASKSDLSDMKSDLIKWMVGTAIGLGVAAITVMTFVLNNATPKVAPTAAPPAIIINVPSQPPPK